MFGRFALRFVLVGVGISLFACTAASPDPGSRPSATPQSQGDRATPQSDDPRHRVTLAFAGDVHFQLNASALLHDPGGLGPITRALSDADVTMVNLESAITERGSWDPKDLERPADRFWYRAPARALDVLADAGVDVVTVANNHGADYGDVGLADTLRAARHAPLTVIGVGRDRAQAFAPHLVRVQDTRVAFLAADASPLESSRSTWTADGRAPGLAAAREPRPRLLLNAVRRADRVADVVVVYLHWGQEGQLCPTAMQRTTAAALAAAGADVIVGSHAHVQLGSGWLQNTYVNYGLGNFVWYHNRNPETGVLRLQLEAGKVVTHQWTPARIEALGGRPLPLSGDARQRAHADWRVRRGCARLAAAPSLTDQATYRSSIDRITPSLRQRMRDSRDPRCPVPLRNLRYLQLGYIGFDGRSHTGEMVVAAAYAREVVGVFHKLYDLRWPIRRMRLVDAYGGDDDRSMAADNTSGFNCRRVKGSKKWSDHAFGAAIDLNPVENPYLSGSTVAPPHSRRFATLDRDEGAPVPPGTITSDDVPVRAFAAIGWEWGGSWSEPDFQHFSAASRATPSRIGRGR